MKNFKTYQLSVSLYKACTALRLPSHLKNQLLRASSSIPLNLADGGAGATTPSVPKDCAVAGCIGKEEEKVLSKIN